MITSTKYYITVLILIGAVAVTACSDSTVVSEIPESDIITENFLGGEFNKHNSHTGGIETGIYSEHLAKVNDQLVENGFDNIRLQMAETLTKNEAGDFQSGQTIFANDRTLRLGSQWVPNDPRRGAQGNDLTHLVFGAFGSANGGSIDGEPAIDASIDTWNNLKKNSGVNVVKVQDTGANPSAILSFDGVTPGNPFLADISTMGFLPGFIFDAVLGPGASNSVLGVAFTFTFLDQNGDPTNDVALKEIWYNDAFNWSTDGSSGTIDIETVALHENGHALGFGHFGKISVINANGKLKVVPRAVMNAINLGVQRDLLGTDKASYNSVYGKWPKK